MIFPKNVNNDDSTLFSSYQCFSGNRKIIFPKNLRFEDFKSFFQFYFLLIFL